MEHEALGLLALARKGGNLQAGEAPVADAIRSGRARLVLIASDAAKNSSDKAERSAGRAGIPAITLETDKLTLGAKLGRENVAVAALTEKKLAEAFLKKLGRTDVELTAPARDSIHKPRRQK